MERIGKFVIHKAAVTSFYARVFFCHDPDLLTPVAIKLFAPQGAKDLPLSQPQLLARFQAEARALAVFDHANVVAVRSYESLSDGRPYFVMPFMAANLPYEIGKDYAAENAPERDIPRRLPLARALTLLRQVGAGLGAMHRKGMVHRAIKPSNILLTARELGSARLADFSMVKLPERNPPLPDHWLLPTPYCAPEQRENASSVGPEADIYSLGILAYRMLTGRLPEGSDEAATLADGFSEPLADLIARATDPDPSRRPANGAAFLQRLDCVPLTAPPKAPVQVIAARKSNVRSY